MRVGGPDSRPKRPQGKKRQKSEVGSQKSEAKAKE
jgi:hypothetical protein